MHLTNSFKIRTFAGKNRSDPDSYRDEHPIRQLADEIRMVP